MAVVLRTGEFGDYYGSPYSSSFPCNRTQMEVNATYIYNYLTSKGWTKESISAMLGNMQAESSINPGRWQSDNVGGGPAYGLVQWDPFTKYTDWCSSNGYSDPSEMDSGLARILYELENKIQWYGTGKFSGMSFEDFSKSTENVSTLAVAFLLCYERPADQSVGVQTFRGQLANNWYTYLGGIPTPVNKKGKKKKYKFILFNKKRRLTNG